MSDLPPSFSFISGQDPHRYFKNLLISFRKDINNEIDIDKIQEDMQKIINAAKDMKYLDDKKSDFYHKPETEKALDKLFHEFKRFVDTFKSSPKEAEAVDLLDSLAILESFVEENEIY